MPTPATGNAIVGIGYLKFITYPNSTRVMLGNPLEREQYHFVGTSYEESLARFQYGKATWSKTTNETFAMLDNGEVWTDRGNNGNGRDIYRLR